ncbi:SDR family NAD(P)-dependent oxidoreductase [Achromobacter seleniivolatilans]|uniref:SDR family NAD(P)-dependent oxidoreductase n=1 Tax=Achromobacter seleniivolatilans TaxID=3047478 RepID=A0ABY9M394_9BURK|nr:SDR family NAD(P)-dependent oxidoreductase [Achromobacter sp. R39]WMD20312.1 SDR family NAD(P)-dependent oxidoreductase [Achromobacter sp. R39]
MNPPVANWTDRRVWLIGASSGIGEALARALLDRGARVVLSARRVSALNQVAGGHPRAAVVPVDAASADVWSQATLAAEQAFGGLDLVIFAAARYDPAQSADFDPALAQKSFDLNVVAIYRCLAEVVPRLVRQQHGGVALVGSISGYTGLPKAMIYGATKAALIHLAESLYFDLAPRKVSVYLINPGFVATPMTAKNDFPMPGLMTPEDAAKAILRGMEKGRFEIRFPRGVAGALRFLSRLPHAIRFRLLHWGTGL